MSTISAWLLIAGSIVVYSAIAGIVFHVVNSLECETPAIPAVLWPMVLAMALLLGPAWAANKSLAYWKTKPKVVKPVLPKASIHKS